MSGTVVGQTVDHDFTAAAFATVPDGLEIVVTDGCTSIDVCRWSTPNTCTSLGDSDALSHASFLLLILGKATGRGAFTIGGNGGENMAWFSSPTDGACGASTSATGGTVTLDSMSMATVAGSVDLTFGTDHLTGTLTAGTCPTLPSPEHLTCK